MKILAAFAVLSAGVAGAAAAGPLEGVQRQIDRNGAMSLITSGADGNDYAVTEGNGVLLGSDVIGVEAGKGGVNANGKSVVGPWVSGGCSEHTRIDLPGSDGSSCD